MKADRTIISLILILSVRAAAAEPFVFNHIQLGAGYNQLAGQLDFRDIDRALREAKAHGATKPDLGRRGYGCMRRDDLFADITCVSHQEKIAGIATREIRLQFLGGMLRQFSITAEIEHFGALMQALRARFGAPLVESATKGRGGTYSWQNGDSKITGYAGKDLVFVSFELTSYNAAAVRRQKRGRSQECR